MIPKLASGSATISPTARRGLSEAIGVLEHHLQLAAVGPHLARREIVDALAAQLHRAGGGLDQLEDRLARGRLAAAALADEAQRLALGDGEGDAVDGMDLAPPREKLPLRTGKCFLSPSTSSSGGRRALMQGTECARRLLPRSQAARWPGRFASSGGASARQRSVA